MAALEEQRQLPSQWVQDIRQPLYNKQERAMDDKELLLFHHR